MAKAGPGCRLKVGFLKSIFVIFSVEITYLAELVDDSLFSSAASNSGDTDSELGLELSHSCAMADR